MRNTKEEGELESDRCHEGGLELTNGIQDEGKKSKGKDPGMKRFSKERTLEVMEEFPQIVWCLLKSPSGKVVREVGKLSKAIESMGKEEGGYRVNGKGRERP